MKISRSATYAVQATVQLAQVPSDVPVPCSRIAAAGKMPERFLLQILRSLVRHGILQSTRGVDGGYALERKPEQISLLEILEAIDGPLGPRAPDRSAVQSRSQEELQRALGRVASNAREQLMDIKLSQLAAPATPLSPESFGREEEVALVE